MPDGRSIIQPDRRIAEAFVAALTGSPDGVVRLRFLHDRDRSMPAAEREGALEQVWPHVMDFQGRGYGVFYFVNALKSGAGSGYGGMANDADVTSIRYLCADFDNGLPDPRGYHTEPSLIVQSSINNGVQRGQVLWRVTDCPVASFKELQQRLAVLYITDPQVCNPSRVFRLPGTLHQKREPSLVTFEDHGMWSQPAPIAALMRGIPLLPEQRPRRDSAPQSATGRLISRAHLRDLLKYMPDYDDRAHWRDVIAAIRATPLTDDPLHEDALAIAIEYSSRWHRWDADAEAELRKIWNTMPPKTGGVGYGTLFHLAKEHGYTGAPGQDPLSVAFAGAAPPQEDDFDPLYDSNQQDDWQKDAARFLRLGTANPAHDYGDEPVNFMDYMSDAEPPPLKMLVPDWIECGIYIALTGIGGTHKSRLLLQFCLAFLYWRQVFYPMIGLREDDDGMSVRHIEYLSYENSAGETHRRFNRIRQKMRLAPGEATTVGATMNVWELRKSRAPLLVVNENSLGRPVLTLTRFGYRFLRRLEKIEGHKVVILDSFFNAVRFAGNSKNYDEPAMAVIETLDHWCEMLNCTILAPFHPSRAGTSNQRKDMGYSPAFENHGRQCLRIEEKKPAKGETVPAGIYTLTITKWNGGEQGKKIDLQFEDGCLVDVGDQPDGDLVRMVHPIEAAIGIAEKAERNAKRLQRGPRAEIEEDALRQQGTGAKGKDGRAMPGKPEQWVRREFSKLTGIGKDRALRSLRKNADDAVAAVRLGYRSSKDRGGAGYGKVADPPPGYGIDPTDNPAGEDGW